MAKTDNINPGLLTSLLGGITSGGITVIDLTMTLDQQVPTGQQADEHPVHQFILTHHHAVDLRGNLSKGFALGVDLGVDQLAALGVDSSANSSPATALFNSITPPRL